jgi:methyl-accepting chemotaxis protein
VKSIGAKIIATFTILLLVVCGCLSFFSYRAASKALIATIEEVLPEKAVDASKIVREKLNVFLNIIEVVAARDRLRNMENSWEDKLKILNAEKERAQYVDMGIADRNGRLKLTSGQEYNVADREFFQQSINGKTFISEPILSDDKGGLIFMTSAPLKDDQGNIVGVIVSIQDALILSDIVKGITFGKEGYAYMVNDEGTVIAHNKLDLVMNQYNPIEEAKKDQAVAALAELHKRMTTGERGVGDYYFQGINRYMGFAPVEGTGWAVAVAAPENEVLARVSNLKITAALITLSCLALGIVTCIFISRSLSKPIIETAGYADKMAAGDLSKDIPAKLLSRKDELGLLAQSFNKMAMNWRGIIGQISAGAEVVAASSQELSAFTQSTAANMQEVSAATEEISASLEEVSASSEEITASSQEMTASLETLNKEIETGSERAKEIEARAVELGKTAANSRETANQLYKDIYGRITKAIEKAKIVDEISNMAELISKLADQTNLLALNAAIEAARAGEMGRGFAVVAEEVRKLAEESAHTVTKIQALTKQVQESINNLVGDANELLDFINNNVNRDYDSFVEVSEQYRQDADEFRVLIQKTAKMSNQVLSVVTEVSKAIEMVAASVAQSSTGAQQIAEKTEGSAATLVQISDSSVKLAEVVEELNAAVKQFKF